MKIAVPLFKERISPHFGSSSKILLMDIEGTKVCYEIVWDLHKKSPMKIARLLVNMGVERMICGGIQTCYKEWLQSKGVVIVDNQKGIARQVLQNILSGILDTKDQT